MTEVVLARLRPQAIVRGGRRAVDDATLAAAKAIVDDIERRGDEALRSCAARYDGLGAEAPLLHPKQDLEAALSELDREERALLERTAERIARYAAAQRAALHDVVMPLAGGRAEQRVLPVARAGCYAPGGGYPLVSTLLMTAVTARVAGVTEVVVATPRPGKLMLAAAAIAEADVVLAAGGAHAIAALAHGTTSLPRVDVIVGPGSRWVTAAKQLVSGVVAIDMLAGPSELVVLADAGADPRLVAADLLAQAEHAADALPVLVTTDETLVERVDGELSRQLASLPTQGVARQALANGYAVVCSSRDEALTVCERLAPEHLELMVDDVASAAAAVRSSGAVFAGAGSAEVLGDYGAGPNHVLPTGGSARYASGLSVMTFLRLRSTLFVDDPQGAAELCRDAAALARLEGLEGHARAAEARLDMKGR
jgi:phosphoribosyl-ATP pyrophosphohydrolase/phosphoribosyl-AMP cyclohydrolase/histidinol dehydrogenase